MSARIGALFAGYGGLELAARTVWPDADLAWVSEFDAAPSRILAHHWPTVPNLGDVTRIDWSTVKPVDVLTGGSPCQDLSAAGKRAGMTAGTRSNLWESMREGIAVLRPSLVIWENVRGALSARAASEVEREPGRLGNGRRRPALRALGRVLGDLASLGYDAAWTGIRAADVGAPHGRWRVFVVAWPQGDRSALTWSQASAERGGQLVEHGVARGVLPVVDLDEVAQVADGFGAQGEGFHASNVGRTSPSSPSDSGSQFGNTPLLPTPAVNDMGASYTPDEWDEWTARMKAAHANGNGHGPSLHIEALRMLPTPRSSDTNGSGAHGDGGVDLRTAVSLLPTPTTQPTTGNGHARDLGSELRMLPTPRATRGGSGTETMYVLGGERSDDDRTQGRVLLPTPTAMDSKGSGGKVGSADVTLTDATERADVRGIDFGVYAPAIARWEAILGRPAPSPTEPTGKGGAQRLSPRFVEWMQGLPDGWVTDVPGITRNHALKALGNGVVPQQAGEGIRWLLDVMAIESRAAA